MTQMKCGRKNARVGALYVLSYSEQGSAQLGRHDLQENRVGAKSRVTRVVSRCGTFVFQQ